MDFEFPEARLLVFAKAPVPGRTKTRLMSTLGARGAARLYAAMVRHTLSWAVRSRLCPVELWCAPACSHPFFMSCRRDFALRLQRQSGGDLGRRMHRALASALSRAPYAVLIGSDCPALTSDDVRKALAALQQGTDAVVGPAEDGGYLLIGLRRPQARLFAGIAWGGARVMGLTRRRLEQLGLSWRELAPRWDVDRPADLRRWKRGHSGNSHVL